MKERKNSSQEPENIHPLETAESAKLRIEQARRLKPLVKESGLKFEVFLPSSLGYWVLEMVENGDFHSPGEAVFVMMGLAKQLDPHQDLKEEILRRELDKRINDSQGTKYYSHEEVKARMEKVKEELKNRPDPPVWEKILVK